MTGGAGNSQRIWNTATTTSTPRNKAGSRAVARSYWSFEATHFGGIEGIISR